MSAHTPGPWVDSWSPDYFKDGAHVVRMGNQSGIVVAAMTHLGPDQANARLIAAAPDLLEALEGAVDALATKYGPDAVCVLETRAAIAKAKGESK